MKKWESNETGGERWERELEPSHRSGASLLLYKQVLEQCSMSMLMLINIILIIILIIMIILMICNLQPRACLWGGGGATLSSGEYDAVVMIVVNSDILAIVRMLMTVIMLLLMLMGTHFQISKIMICISVFIIPFCHCHQLPSIILIPGGSFGVP